MSATSFVDNDVVEVFLQLDRTPHQCDFSPTRGNCFQIMEACGGIPVGGSTGWGDVLGADIFISMITFPFICLNNLLITLNKITTATAAYGFW
jgi:hypothetical protein